MSNCGLSPVAVAVVVVVVAVDVLASHEQGPTGTDAVGAGINGSAGVVDTAGGEGGGGGDTSSVVSIELSSLSSDTLRTRVIG